METRGWKLCVCFGLLSVALATDASQSVPGAREDESTFSKFNLVSDSKSHLFSTCFDDLNSVEATVHAIKVAEEKEYIRYLIDSDAEVTWEDVEGEDDIIACAFKAYEAGSPMFKYSNGVCSLATEGVYNPKDASCDGEEVFIVSPLDFCFTSLGVGESGDQFDSWLCATNCGSSGILTDQSGAAVDPNSLPSEIVECCATDMKTCFQPSKDFDSPCKAERYCHFLGMILPSVAPGEGGTELFFDNFFGGTTYKTLVNVRYEDGSWYHFPLKKLVSAKEWEGATAPTTEGFVVVNDAKKLSPVGDSDSVSVVCQPRNDLAMCTE